MRSFLIVLLAVVLSVLAVKLLDSDNGASSGESAFERVMRTGVIRCGYYVFPPVTYRDPNTKELSGWAVDMMNSVAEKADLKLEWTEEVNFANWTEALQTGRFDAMCAPIFAELPLLRSFAVTDPIAFAGLHPLVRLEDKRLMAGGMDEFNKAETRFVVQDGSGLGVLTREVFPNATIKQYPMMMDGPTLLQEIIGNKADVILLDKNAEIMYNRINGKVFHLRDDLPAVKLQPFVLVVNRGDADLKAFLDFAIMDMIVTGQMDRIIAEWEPEKGTFLRVAKPSE